jgi:hypothetical protein
MANRNNDSRGGYQVQVVVSGTRCSTDSRTNKEQTKNFLEFFEKLSYLATDPVILLRTYSIHDDVLTSLAGIKHILDQEASTGIR